MIIEKSPLCLLDTSLLRFDFKFSPIESNSEVQIGDLFSSYTVDIDFRHIAKGEQITVFIRADINSKLEKWGYGISAECGCIFQFDSTIEADSNLRKSLSGYSTIYIALNTLRGYITSITANGPLGKYTLPSIDLNKLIEGKLSTKAKENDLQASIVADASPVYGGGKPVKPKVKPKPKARKSPS